MRKENQDTYRIARNGDICVVCDGMGGALAGDVASALAVEVASAYLESLSREELRQRPVST